MLVAAVAGVRALAALPAPAAAAQALPAPSAEPRLPAPLIPAAVAAAEVEMFL
jgi:hypothetical protein